MGLKGTDQDWLNTHRDALMSSQELKTSLFSLRTPLPMVLERLWPIEAHLAEPVASKPLSISVGFYFTVTDFARLRGLSGSFPRLTAA